MAALSEFFGSAAGLSASTVQRLTVEWTPDLEAFNRRDLSQVDYVYLWRTGSTSTSGWRRTGCAAWSWSVWSGRAQRASGGQ